MKVEYSDRAISDLIGIADYYASIQNPKAGDAVAARIRDVVARIAVLPESGRRVAQRQGARAVPVSRHPYLVFYELAEPGVVRILHIRHTSRRPWAGH